MTNRWGVRLRPWVLFGVATLVVPLVACDASEENVGEEPPAAAEAPPGIDTVTGLPMDSAAAVAAAAEESKLDTVNVNLTEYAIEMPTTLFPGGTTFRITNNGGMEHGLELEMGETEFALPTTLASGETRSMLITLSSGTWDVYCPVADHATRGMRVQLTVR